MIKSFTTFRLDDQLFGIDIMFIREINRQMELSMVPHAPDYVSGLINLRGQIVTVLDLKARLNLGRCHISSETHNLILKTDAELADLRRDIPDLEDVSIPDKVGLLVDRIGDVVTIPEEAIAPPPANVGKLDGSYLAGVATLEENLLTILSMKSILMGVN